MKINTPWFLLLISIAILSYFTITFSEMGTFILWGEKTNAIFDIWSIQHVLSGILGGYFLLKVLKIKNTPITYLYYVLAFSILWESLELYFEVTSLNIWIFHWQSGVEFWVNRLIADPLLVIIGSLIYKKTPKLLTPSIICVILFFAINLFVPENTTLQVILFS